jgi:hypothetical protein
MKNKIMLMLCLFVVSTIYGAETTKKVETKYLRPSVANFFFQPKNDREKKLIDQFGNLAISSRFNDHRVSYNFLSCSETTDDLKKPVINQFLQKATAAVMAKWWNRDANGNFNYDFVAKSGLYTATDADAIMAKGSNIDRREMMGEDLIGKTYLLVYEFPSVITKEQHYDQQDAFNKKLGITKPVSRNNEGWVANYNVYAYKLVYNDSVSNDFYTKYWTDVNNHDAAKVAQWASATFPVEFAYKTSGSIESSQLKKLPAKMKKNMDELLQAIPARIQEEAMFSLGQGIEDFNLKATVYGTKPLTAKLGTKESLYLDQRFFIFEIEADQDGNQTKVLKGVARAKKIEDNLGVAIGESKPSTFRQQGGKALYEGMFIESKEDVGGIFNAGFYVGGSDRSFNGINLGLDYRISKYLKTSGVYAGIDFSYNPFMSKVYAGSVYTAEGYKLMDSGDWFSGSTYTFAVKINKEMYLGRKGNLYLNPSFGLGILGYTFSKSNNDFYDFKIYSGDKEKQNPDYSWTSFIVPMSVGIGYYIKPSMSVELRPVYRIKSRPTTGNGDRLEQYGGYDEGWGFDNLGSGSSVTSVLLNFRLRF